MFEQITTEQQIDSLVPFAESIWFEHFSQYFDEKLLSEIFEIVQSNEAIRESIDDGYLFFYIRENEKQCGYLSYIINRETNEMFLSKLYIHADYRGTGIGRKTIDYLKHICTSNNLHSIRLDVYSKNSDSITAYEKIGFIKEGTKQKKFREDIVFTDFNMVLYV